MWGNPDWDASPPSYTRAVYFLRGFFGVGLVDQKVRRTLPADLLSRLDEIERSVQTDD